MNDAPETAEDNLSERMSAFVDASSNEGNAAANLAADDEDEDEDAEPQNHYLSHLHGDRHFPWRDDDLFYTTKEMVFELAINDGALGNPDRVAIFNDTYKQIGACESDNEIWDKVVSIIFTI